MSQDFLNQLNDVQREAATNYDGAALIIAGAGSGKTRVLTFRIAHMLREGVRPYSILALTFTNKAATEMRERIAKVVEPERAAQIWMGTFHSVFARILRKEAENLGFTSNFTIYDSTDSQNLVKNIIKEKNLNDEKYKPRAIASRISLAKNNLITPAAYSAAATYIAEDREMQIPQFCDVYREYMVRCKSNNAMDFDDLLLYTNILFRDFPEVTERYQDKFRYILVDEYQDTNVAQYLIIKRIAAKHGNIAVVGDDSQSIYSFRGAKIENILRFQEDYPTSKVYKLEQNYRSTQTIVNAANSVIDNNRNRLKKRSFSDGDVGDKIKVYKLYTDKEEAINVANDIKSRVKSEGKSYNDFAILYRTNAQSRTFEESLRSRNIPYKIYGGFSFYQRAEIKNILAYARVLVNPNDTEALLRIINFPARGIGATTIARLAESATANGVQLFDMLKKIAASEIVIKGVNVAKLASFISIIDHLSAVANHKDVYDSVNELCYSSGIIALYKENKSVENQSAMQNIEELLNSLKQLCDQRQTDGLDPLSLAEWLESIVLITSDTEQEDSDEKVTLMTIHSAKGLEFDEVFIVGLEEGLFPLEGSSGSLSEIEEERRLFYVAITRAVKRLTISLCQNRYRWGRSVNSQPSRFLKEIDNQYLDVDDCESEYSDAVKSSFAPKETSDYQKNSYQSNRPQWQQKKTTTSGSAGSERSYSEPSRDMSRFKRVASKQSHVATNNELENLAVGDKVKHKIFGFGEIISLEKSLNGTKAVVNFNGSGQKSLLLKFANLEIVE